MEQTIRLERRFAIIDEWLLDLDISDRAVRLYAVLARYADSETHKAYPSRGTLAERLRCSKASVDRAAQELVDAGAMTKKQRHNSSVIYTLQVSSPLHRGVITDDEGGSAPVMRGVLTGDDLTITTELEPTELELLNKKVNDFEQLFAEWWEVYPNKKAKGAAKVAYRKALKKVPHDLLMARVERYRDDPNRVDLYTPYPQKWLNEERWDDAPETPRIEHKPRKLTNAEEGLLLVQKYRAEEAARQQQPKELDYDMGLRLKGVDDE
jgi:hypothetical protein